MRHIAQYTIYALFINSARKFEFNARLGLVQLVAKSTLRFLLFFFFGKGCFPFHSSESEEKSAYLWSAKRIQTKQWVHKMEKRKKRRIQVQFQRGNEQWHWCDSSTEFWRAWISRFFRWIWLTYALCKPPWKHVSAVPRLSLLPSQLLLKIFCCGCDVTGWAARKVCVYNGERRRNLLQPTVVAK